MGLTHKRDYEQLDFACPLVFADKWIYFLALVMSFAVNSQQISQIVRC